MRGSIGAVWRALSAFESQKIVPAVAVRNTIGFTCAVIAGTVLGSPSTGVVAGLGALNVCYSDGLDPYLLRARRMLLSALLSGAAVTLGALSGHSNAAAIALAALWAFAAGMLVALGTTAADLGVITLVTLVVFAAKPLPPMQALETGAVAVGGGLLQTLCSTFLWPIRRYVPERRILAEIYGELAKLPGAPHSDANTPPMTKQISEAQDALAPLTRDHSVEAERQVFLLVQGERIRLSILNLGRLRRRIARDGLGIAAATALGQILDHVSTALGFIGQRIQHGDSAGATGAAEHAAIEQLSADLVEFHAYTAGDADTFFTALLKDAGHQANALRSQIRSAAWAADASADRPFTGSSVRDDNGEAELNGHRQLWRLRFQGHRARLLANLSLESTVFRHAVRMAVCLAMGDAIGRASGLQRTYWIPMTIAIVLKPDFTSTFARGLLRIGGTMAGLILATLLFRFIHAGMVTDIALMSLFTLLLRWAGPANYGIFVVAISGLVVLLIAVTGVAPGVVISARALNTALGGALALIAYAVWPTWEKTQTRAALADMLDAYCAYTRAVFGGLRGWIVIGN